MAIPKPKPQDWLKASALELKLGDREALKVLRESYAEVQKILKQLPDTPDSPLGTMVYRAQLERTRRALLGEQAKLFDRLGDSVSARRLRAATRSAKLSRAADNALLTLAGAGEEGKRLYEGAQVTSQRTVDVILARAGLSAVPLAERIYNTSSWMNKRLDRLINQTLARGLNARKFAKVARDWFNPSVKGGTRYAAMRLARTEINNAFHATSIAYAQDKPWVSQMDWNLSGSHVVPDKCNDYALLSPWNVHEIPRKPHPQCMCYVTETPVNEDAWVDQFIAGDFDSYLDGELAAANAQLGIKEPEPVQEPERQVAGSVPFVTPPPAPDAPLTGNTALKSVPKGLTVRGSLDTKQRKALKDYESAFFFAINGFLRRGAEPQDASGRRMLDLVESIDSAMNESLLPNSVQSWRGMSRADQLFGDRLSHDVTGFSWEEKAFSSTSTEEKIAKQFMNVGANPGGEVLMRVVIPAHSKALKISESHNGNQAEILLQRNTRWKVVQDHGINDRGIRRLDVTAEPIPEGESGRAAERQIQPTDIVRTNEPQQAGPAEIAKPVAESDGYVPGAWTLQSDHEAQIQAIEANLRKLTPEDQHAGLRKIAEEFVAGTTDDTDLEFHNGPHIVRFTGELTEEQRQTFLGYVDQLQTAAPTGRNMHIVVAPSKDFEVGVGGETTLSTGYMRINEQTLKEKVWHGMPVSNTVSSALYVLAHEWGHSFPAKEDAREEHIHHEAIAAGGMSRYGKTTPAESYAEAFAEWLLSSGRTTNKAAQSYAKRFEWGERFGIH